MSAIPTVSIRMKPPRGPVTNDLQALRAFHALRQATEFADRARADFYRYSGGTQTGNRHHERACAYAEVADAWAGVLKDWLDRKAGEEMVR